MDRILSFLILGLFIVVVFGRSYFPSAALYWSVYFLMFILVALLWFAMFWVSRKRNVKVLGFEPDADFFVGKVSPNVRDDLQRGRMSFKDGKITLVSRKKGKFEKVWSADVSDIQSVGFGKVAGVRKGFTFHTENGDVSFTCVKLFKNRDLLYKALGWEFEETKDVQN